jgi:curved DNA-binding protein
MDFKDYYALLGVEPDADAAAIKTAYRRLARKYHPDISKEDDAEARFKDVAEAWQVLKDPDKRADYDQLRALRNQQGDHG